jgi:hypothetical protein
VRIRRVLNTPTTGASIGLAASPGEGSVPRRAEVAASDGGGLAVREADLRTSIRPTVAEVDLGALCRNVARVRAIVGPDVGIHGVVKADAYGHGAVKVAGALAPMVDALAVSLVEEGLEVRGAGITCPILALGAYYRHTQSEVLEEGLTPVVYDIGELQRFGSTPHRRKPRHAGTGTRDAHRWPMHVKFNTSSCEILCGISKRVPRIYRTSLPGVRS